MSGIGDNRVEDWATTDSVNDVESEQFIKRNLAAQWRNMKSAIRYDVSTEKWRIKPEGWTFTETDVNNFTLIGPNNEDVLVHRKLVATAPVGIYIGTIITASSGGGGQDVTVSWSFGSEPAPNEIAGFWIGLDPVVPQVGVLDYVIGSVADADYNHTDDRYELIWKNSGANIFGDQDFSIHMTPFATAFPTDKNEFIIREIKKWNNGFWAYPLAPPAGGVAHTFMYKCQQRRQW